MASKLYSVDNVTRQRVVATKIVSAQDSVSRRRGLLGVSGFEAIGGLWINPCEAVHTFGMQLALDVLFLDRNLRVRKIAKNLPPNRIAFCFTASSVLELAAGSVAACGTESGDQLALRQYQLVTVDSCVSRLEA